MKDIHNEYQCYIFIIIEDSSSLVLPPVDLGPYFPYLAPNTALSPEELQHYQFELNESTTKLKRRFASLVYDVQRSIEETGKFKDAINLLKYYNPDFDKILKDCTCSHDVFDKLSRFFSFFDYDVIKLLSHKLGSDTIKRKLNSYKKKFQDFSKNRICECPSDIFGDRDQAEKVYVLKTDKSFSTLTGDDIEKLKYEMNKILRHKFLRFLDVEEGCVKVTFRTIEQQDTIGNISQK